MGCVADKKGETLFFFLLKPEIELDSALLNEKLILHCLVSRPRGKFPALKSFHSCSLIENLNERSIC